MTAPGSPTEDEHLPVWGPDETFELDGITFSTRDTPKPLRKGRPFLFKWRELLDELLAVYARFPHGNIVEVGMFKGGSMMVTALVARPRKLVGLDINEPHPTLAEFVEQRGLHDSVSAHWEIDQGDRDTVTAIIDAEFGDEDLDLVIDDASHRLEPTRTTFEVLFPRLRPGGLFIIEDWRWQHVHADLVSDALSDPNAPGHEATKASFRDAVLANRPAFAERLDSPARREAFEKTLLRRLRDRESFAAGLNHPRAVERVFADPDGSRASFEDPDIRAAFDERLAEVAADPDGFAAAIPDDQARATFRRLVGTRGPRGGDDRRGGRPADPAEPSDADTASTTGRQRPLTELGLELFVAKAGNAELIGELRVTEDWIVVERGPAPLERRGWRLAEAYPDQFGLVGRIRG